MDIALPASYYCILKSSAPAGDDFTSYAVQHSRDILQGRRPRRIPDTGDALHMWSGISVYDSEALARANAMYWRAQGRELGSFLCRLDIPAAAGKAIRFERTSDAEGHHTLWGRPATLLACVDLGSIVGV